MKNTVNRWDIATYAWLIITTLTTKPVIPLIAIGMMTFCFIMSWVNDHQK